MLVKSSIARRMFSADEVLVPAQSLLDLDGVSRANLDEVTYYHILFDRHEIIEANGAYSESLYTGPEAMKSLEGAQRDEIHAIFPEVREIDYTAKPARALAKTSTGAILVKRHIMADQKLM